MNKTKKISLIAVLALAVAFGLQAGMSQATLTLGATSISSKGALTLTGAGDSTWSTTGDLTVDSTAALNLGTTGATSAVIGSTAATSALTLQGTAEANYTIGTATNTGVITIGNSIASNTISIGSAAPSDATQTINVGNGDAATSGGVTVAIANGVPGVSTTNAIFIGTAGTTTGTVGVTIGSIGTTAHTTAIRGGGTGAGITLQTAPLGTIAIGAADQTGAITIGTSTAGETVDILNTVNTGANTINIGASTVNADAATTVNILTGAATSEAQAVNIATGAAGSTTTIGNTTSTSALNLRAGSGGVNVTGIATFNGAIRPAVSVITPSATPTMDTSLANVFTLTPGEDESISATNQAVGQSVDLIVTATASSCVITFGTGFESTEPLATGTDATTKIIVRFVSDGTTLYEVARTSNLQQVLSLLR